MMNLGLDMHGGSFGGGKYRKGSILEDQVDIQKIVAEGSYSPLITIPDSGTSSTAMAGSCVDGSTMYTLFRINYTVYVSVTNMEDLSIQTYSLGNVANASDGFINRLV